jgi:hypothetical protein
MARRIVSQSRCTGNLSAEELAAAHDRARTLRSNARRIAGQDSIPRTNIVAQYETQEDGSSRRVLVVVGEQREALRSSWHGACPEPNEHFRRNVARKGIGRGAERAIERCYQADSHKV